MKQKLKIIWSYIKMYWYVALIPIAALLWVLFGFGGRGEKMLDFVLKKVGEKQEEQQEIKKKQKEIVAKSEKLKQEERKKRKKLEEEYAEKVKDLEEHRAKKEREEREKIAKDPEKYFREEAKRNGWVYDDEED